MRPGWLLIVALLSTTMPVASEEAVQGQEPKPSLRVAIVPVEGHSTSVDAVAAFPDGKRFLTGGGGVVKEWDVESGRVLRTFAFNGPVYKIAISSDGNRFTVGSFRIVELWDVGTGNKLRQFNGGALAISPDGRTLAAYDLREKISLRDAQTGDELYSFVVEPKDGVGYVRVQAFSPNGSLLAVWVGDDVELWNVKERRRSLKLANIGNELKSAAIFSPDGMRLLTAHGRDLKLWDVSSGRLLWSVSDKADVSPAAFSPNGDTILSGGGDSVSDDHLLVLRNAATGDLLRTFAGHTQIVGASAFLDEDRALSASYDESVKLWDIKSGKLLRTYRRNAPQVTALAVSPDGRQIAAGSAALRLHLWNASTGVLERDIDMTPSSDAPVKAVTYAPDSAALAVALYDELSLWNSRTGERMSRPLESRYDNRNWVTAVDYSRDGKQLALVTKNWWCYVYSIYKTCDRWMDRVLLEVLAVDSKAKAAPTVMELRVESDSWLLAGFSADANSVWFAGADEIIRRWDTANDQDIPQALVGHKDKVTAIALSLDRTLLLSAGQDGQLKLWDLETGALRKEGVVPGGTVSIGMSPAGAGFFAASSEGQVSILDTDLQLVGPIKEPNGIAMTVYTSDGQRLVVADKNGKLTLWDVQSRSPVVSFFDFADGSWISVTPEGYFEGVFDLQSLPVTSRGLEVLRDPKSYKFLHRPDLLREKIMAR